MKKLRILALACAFVAFASTQAMAEGFAVYEWSARGIALGGATVAREPDPSVVAANPAAITGLEGKQMQLGLSIVKPYGRIKMHDGPKKGSTYKLKDSHWAMPGLYYTQKLNDRLSVGIGEFSRFGLGFTYPKSWAGTYNIYKISLSTASVTPVLAYKVTDKLSIGGGLEFMYLDITIQKTGAVPGLGTADIDVTGQNLSLGASLAAHYQFNDKVAAGITYRSPVKHRVSGESEIKPDAGIAGHPLYSQVFKDQDVSAKVTMPESVNMGISLRPSKKLSLELGAVWTRWSRFTNLDLYFESPVGLGYQASPKNWKNTWRFNIGVEYALTDWVDLRLGYVWDGCPVNDKHAEYLIPTDGRNIYSAGAGFKLTKALTLDLAYAFVDPRERTYETGTATGVYASKTYSSGTHIASVSVGYKF
ncbi:OmpP1/FadL family transporter [Desulfovibrio sp. OttesenSCG-928-F07]|nr:OmpP1/FadL family transporter [Desulfovibrio sp. OttesenSCG-928-F07]